MLSDCLHLSHHIYFWHLYPCQTTVSLWCFNVKQTHGQKVAEGSCLAKQRMEVAEMPVKSRSSNRWPNLWPRRAGKTGKKCEWEKTDNQYYGCGRFWFILSSWTLSPFLIFQSLWYELVKEQCYEITSERLISIS